MKYCIAICLLVLAGCPAHPSSHHPLVEDAEVSVCPDSSVPAEDSSVPVEDSSVVVDSSVADSGRCPLGCVPAADYICYPDPEDGCYFQWLDLYKCSQPGYDCQNNECGNLWDCIIQHNLPPGELAANCD